MKDFYILSTHKSPASVWQNKKVYSRLYRIEALVPGKAEIPSLAFQYFQKKKSKNQFVISPVKFEIESKGKGEARFHDIRDVNTIKLVPFWMWLLLGILPFFGLGIGIYYWKRHQAVEKIEIKDPKEIALEALEHLLSLNYLRKGEFKLFYFELTKIVRNYMEGAYSLRAPHQTTEEFLLELSYSEEFSKCIREKIIHFLNKADLVKYAAQIPSLQEIDEILFSAKTIINSEVNA